MSSLLLPNHLGGRWHTGAGTGIPLFDPVLGTELARVDRTGLDITAGLDWSRAHAGAALRALTYRERAGLLASCLAVLQAQREAYQAIALANSGTTARDSAIDIDGALFTLGQYARWGERLGDARALLDGDRARLGKDEGFQSQHLLTPSRGIALLINAFNFPAWGLWEKAAPALLSGVPVVVKPATATAWLTQRMVQDVVDAGVLPAGALSVVCGPATGLLDALQPFDLLSFTGSAETAADIRRHPAIAARSVRCNVEADSLNSALLAPDAQADSEILRLFAQEVAREMTVKSGQKCTAIRRALVPRSLYEPAAQAIAAELSRVSVGNPRHASVRMGALVSRAQFDSVAAGLMRLQSEADTLYDGRTQPLIDADPAVAACMQPVLLGTRDPGGARLLHDIEVFGPVATLMPYDSPAEAFDLIRRAQGSLVCSVMSDDPRFIADATLELGSTHGRVHAISSDVAALHTGHGNVMPQSLHGGPGRAGGGEELGGLRALGFYHRRTALQASTASLDALAVHATPLHT